MASSPEESTLLGLCDGEIDENKHQSSVFTNKIGGLPDWLPGLPCQSPLCRRCSSPLTHVVQVYCPLEESSYHRAIHVFACPAVECRGRAESWTAVRSQSLEAEVRAQRTSGKHEPVEEAPMSSSDWCDSAEDWGMEEEDGGALKMDKRVLEEEPEFCQAPEGDVVNGLRLLHLAEGQVVSPLLRAFFISVVDESDVAAGEEDGLAHAEDLLRDYERRERVAVGHKGGGDKGGEEKYEKSRARHGDAVFSRFTKRISSCPQQILRYCRGGPPLFISEPPADAGQLVAPCDSCGGPRTLELQLMPALVSLLRWRDDGAEADLEFGTVLVYTCTRSCWTSPRAVEEFCFVQMDPDQQLFK
ncbi:programmed cell death protein 2-like isoform X2 [Nerophis ophidion]|uniref:programmed cell death protein 2-like isoform X2 n=1 Tax=Nerophis ophidion TaxID=159077 RepID=UPI002AE04428|nr:programmed cell death protein 2-like isoform X2 [Nerophis ophidion]